MKDIFSPLEIDDQWDHRAPMVDEDVTTVVTDDDSAGSTSAQPEPAAAPAPEPAAAQPSVSHLNVTSDESGSGDAALHPLGQTVFEPQYKPEGATHPDDAAVSKLTTDEPKPAEENAEEADTTEAPAESTPASTPDEGGLNEANSSEKTLPASDDEVVADVDKNVSDMISKLDEESKRLDDEINTKTSQIQGLQGEIDAHNAKKAEVQKRIDGLRQVVG